MWKYLDRNRFKVRRKQPAKPQRGNSDSGSRFGPHDGSRRSVVIWDVSASGRVPSIMDPYVTALRVKDIAGSLGRLVQASAYVEPPFSLFDKRPRTYAEELHLEDLLGPTTVYEDGDGITRYTCSYCGASQKSHRSLVLHFKDVHEKERGKRMQRLGLGSAANRIAAKMELAETKDRYMAAEKMVMVMPKHLVEDELSRSLHKAGYEVRLCSDKPYKNGSHLTDAQHSIVNNIWHAVNAGVACLCLVCDSAVFGEYVGVARQTGMRVVGIGPGASQLRSCVDLYINWGDVASGHAQVLAADAAARWFPYWCEQNTAITTVYDVEVDHRKYAECSEAEFEEK